MTKSCLSLKNRFIKHVSISEKLDDCWKWIGSKNPAGYGRFSINNKMYLAHRVSFELFVGPIPNKLCVCHSCDNPGCVNPAHLWLGTDQDNVNDKLKKNREVYVKGERHGMHKLTEQQVYQIREMLKQGYAQKQIAVMFNVSTSRISSIKRGRQWNWLRMEQ